MTIQEEFTEIYQQYIHREGADKFLDYLQNKSDFFIAPASTRFHGSYAGGLAQHSINVYRCLRAYLDRKRVQEEYGMHYSDETVALVSLLHDVCKIGCYKAGTRNVKDENGVWQKVPIYNFDDPLPYGHGEKSVYILSGFMRLSREEAFAIRFHMGFSGQEDKGLRAVCGGYGGYVLLGRETGAQRLISCKAEKGRTAACSTSELLIYRPKRRAGCVRRAARYWSSG